jgi:hypothetical protein
MQSTGSEFLAEEMRETEMAKPGAKILSFEGRDLRDSVPNAPVEPDQKEQYDLICVDNLVEKLRTSDKARELMAALFSGLGPGGRLLVGSQRECLADDTPDAQDLAELAELSSHIPDEEISGQAIFLDRTGRSVFLEVYKKAA